MREQGEGLEGYDGGAGEEFAGGVLGDYLRGGGCEGVEDAGYWGGWLVCCVKDVYGFFFSLRCFFLISFQL